MQVLCWGASDLWENGLGSLGTKISIRNQNEATEDIKTKTSNSTVDSGTPEESRVNTKPDTKVVQIACGTSHTLILTGIFNSFWYQPGCV